eukprot:13647990-Alexandrium_andersonii.AAC.1
MRPSLSRPPRSPCLMVICGSGPWVCLMRRSVRTGGGGTHGSLDTGAVSTAPQMEGRALRTPPPP